MLVHHAIVLFSLREWHSQLNITDAASKLLICLKIFHPMLPSSINGLVGKKIPYFVYNIGYDNFYYHFHIKDHVIELIKAGVTDIFDGLQLFKSNSDEFWPIFMKCKHHLFLLGSPTVKKKNLMQIIFWINL